MAEGPGPGRLRSAAQNHRHRLRPVRAYDDRDAATLLGDFWAEVNAVLKARGGAAMSETDAGGVLRAGIAPYEAMKARTMAVARGERRVGPDEPRVWFTSLESFTRVLSERNRDLLALIAEREPGSLAELAALSGRAKPNLSRTLRTMERHGLVELQRGEGRACASAVSGWTCRSPAGAHNARPAPPPSGAAGQASAPGPPPAPPS